MYTTESGYDSPPIVWIHYTLHSKVGVSLSISSGVRLIPTPICHVTCQIAVAVSHVHVAFFARRN